MEKSAELSRLEETLVNKLNEVRDILDSQRDELSVSIRKDVVAITLKDMIESHTSFYSLKAALEEYIKDLYSNINIVEVNKNERDENNE